MAKKLLFAKDDLEKIARFGLPTKLQFAPGSNAAALSTLAGKAFDLRETFAERFDQIAEDPNLSEMGQAAARRALGEEYLLKLERVQLSGGEGFTSYSLAEALDLAAKKRTKRQGELDAASKVSARESVADAVRDGIVWNLIREMDPLVRSVAFSDAIRDGDSETFGAFARSPKIMRLLEPKVREEGISSWNARVNPDAAREVRELGEAESLVTSAFGQVRQFVESAVGLPGADPLRQVAAGKPSPE